MTDQNRRKTPSSQPVFQYSQRNPALNPTDIQSVRIDERSNLGLAGFPIQSMTASRLETLLQWRLQHRQKTMLLFANTNFVMQCLALRDWLCTPDVVLVNDGVGLDIAALLLHGRRYAQNLNGTDFVPRLLKSLAGSQRIFLLGAKPGVALQAAGVIERASRHVVAGCRDGYSALSIADQCAEINASGAQIVLVALGNPAQENWMQTHAQRLDAPLVIGVGALLDFLSGEVQRAPLWVQRMRCEWLYRLAHEPQRLLRRYTVDIIQFLYLCISFRRAT